MSEKRLYQTIAREIRALIDSGDFPVGARLPGERELAERFNVSRVTIREAEIALEAQGRISIRTGSGVYVTRRPEGGPDALPNVTAFELTAARAVIEAEAAALAAANITDDEIDELEELILSMSRADDGSDSGEDADRLFHLTIARISGNPVIEYFVQMIWRMRTELPRVKRVYASVCKHDSGARADEHSAILAALRNRDPAAARIAMRDHFHRLFETMLEAAESEALSEVRRRTELDRERFLATTRI
ncbi:FadR/GntR family transcriptional regulator [uncultured Brevundimonas sp.]|uniref:FadR/GntR family transcriptional regulator n=1 Tax=uncultured Brevundimonas sp. TaxID=213418 RepID=UPI0030EF2FD2|tara:strand:+ start:13795 stop:14538 length:744 start_codon:yes stop_codon:yes gene_type:complete